MVKALSFRYVFATCLVVAILMCGSLAAQEPDQGPGGQAPPGGGQPPNQPTNQPQPRQPINQPQPTNPNNMDGISIRGRIIAGPRGLDRSIVEVRFETDGGQPIGFAYADSSGEFTFRQSGINLDQTLYVVVNLEGYKPHRERLYGLIGNGTFDFITIFLETESTTTVPAKGGTPVVDLRQLRAKIPGKAVDEYEKALKESGKGNRSKAVEGLQRAIKLAPDFYEAQHSLGVQFMALEKYDEAEAALIRARDLSPKAAEPLINLGTLYYQQGQVQVDAGKTDEADVIFN